MLAKVFSNSLFYTFSSLFLRASSIIFFPIFSYYLNQADYGILSVSQSITVLVTSLAGFELHRAITRFINSPESQKKSEFRKKFLGNIILTTFISNSVFVLFLLLFGSFFLKPILNNIPFYPYIFFSLIGILFNFLVDLYRVYLKATHQGKASFIFDMAFYSSNILLNLFFVVVLKKDVIGIIYSTIVCGFVFSSISIFKLFKVSSFSIKKSILFPVINYVLPLIPFIWLGMGVETVSTLFLNMEEGKEVSGIYYIAITFATIFSAIKESIISAISPWFFEFYQSKKYLINKLFIHIILAGAIINMGISIFSFEVLTILSSKKSLVEAWKYIPLLNIGHLIIFIGQLLNLPMYYTKSKTSYLILANLGGFITTFIISFLITESYGIQGAVISKTSGYFIMTVISGIISINFMKFDINYFNIFIIVLFTTVLSYLNFLPFNYPLLLSLKIFISLVLLFFFLKLVLKSYFGVKRLFLTYRSNLFRK
ncbi:lipopolysaccharide biosynthesis protein [Flexithrix dorotheae]|uniref:lipopolysaccharide biosynthesis protein n=1 Tax=Flexithrix dorotheae TaxID=70993 RepID=UPI000364FEB3|nr:oligosaccharide flippase family protein [Flexithrix dorotheae]